MQKKKLSQETKKQSDGRKGQRAESQFTDKWYYWWTYNNGSEIIIKEDIIEENLAALKKS